MLKERMKHIANKHMLKMSDLFYKAIFETLKTMPKSNQEEINVLR